MNINWQVRVKNPLWWAQVVVAIVMPLIVGMGYEWQDMTSWATLFSTIWAALNNPVVVVSMITSLWMAVMDPTTKGFKDSEQAMTYTAPKDDAEDIISFED
ncbi:MAG: phage holin [Clostridia bacterium]|nr:phage holin [Clostridia bacterium]